jgi:SAM-dependent methyltransferase
MFPVINGVIQMVPGSWLKEHSDLLYQTDAAASKAIDEIKSTKYETLRFETRRGSKRNSAEQSIVSRFLQKHPEGIWVLDVPCGMGRFNDVLARYNDNVLSIDKRLGRSAYTVSSMRSHSTVAIQGDALSLPLRNDSVDVALCIRLTHHLNKDNTVKLLKELGRVAIEVLITFYNADTFRAKYRRFKKMVRSKHPVYSYSMSNIMDMAAAAGLSIVSIYPRFGFRFFQRPIQFLHLKRIQLLLCILMCCTIRDVMQSYIMFIKY